MPGGCVDEGRGHEAQPPEGFAVTAQGYLVLGAALHVLEYEAGQAAPGDLAQVRDVERARNVAAAERASFPGHA